jgi:hypothetical protein
MSSEGEDSLRGLSVHEFDEAVSFSDVGLVELADDLVHFSELAKILV